MINFNLKDFFEEIKKRNISIESNNGDENMFYRFNQLYKNLFEQNAEKYVNEEDILSISSLPRPKTIKQRFTYKQVQTQIVSDLIIKQKHQSDTDSLSLIVDHSPQIRFMDSLKWYQLFGENKKIFKPFMFNSHFIKIQQLDENSKFDQLSSLIIDKGSNTNIFSGFNVQDDTQIAIKETIAKIDFVEQTQQYILHAEIYELYPDAFLKIILPVFVKSISQDEFVFQSQMELGEINLFKYSQQHKISDNEYQLIYEQLYNQVILLHQNKIAHRDIKPQNIIFVKNKGWLLCDFGEAIKYSQQISVYNIRGTFGFIPPTVYQSSKIGDVLVKQDLLYNDLYALGVTLLIIKHQISKSSEIQEFMNKQDNIIEQLISNPLNLIDKLNIIPRDIFFIEPKFDKQKNDSQLQRMEINEYVNILKFVNSHISPGYITFIINSIEDFLESVKLNEKLYLSICKNLYFCTRYIKRFKNIPSLKTLRLPKFWRQNFKRNDIKLQEISIVFMYQLGFVDLVLKYGSQFLSNSYSFTIHLIMIKLLILLKENTRALHEYQLVLIFREQYFMNEDDLKFFINISVFMMDCKLIDKTELDAISEDVWAARFDISKLDLNFNDPDEEICQQFLHQFESYQRYTNDYWFDQAMTQFAKYQIEKSYTLSLCDKLYDRIFEIHKYSCPSFLYLNYLKESYMNKISLSTNQSQLLRQIRKKINYLFIYNSESAHQFQIHNLIKYSVTIFNSFKKLQQNERAFQKIFRLIRQFKILPFEYYKIGSLYELKYSLIYIFKNHKFEPRLIKIAILSYNNVIEYGLKVLSEKEMSSFVMYILIIITKSRSFGRLLSLTWFQKISLNQKFYYQLTLKKQGKTKSIRDLMGKNLKLQKLFLLEQFFALKC